MSKWWLAAAAIFLVAAASVWFAFQSPEFVAGLTSIAVAAAWKALAPKIAQRKTPEEEAKHQKAFRAGREDQYNRKRDGRPPKG